MKKDRRHSGKILALILSFAMIFSYTSFGYSAYADDEDVDSVTVTESEQETDSVTEDTLIQEEAESENDIEELSDQKLTEETEEYEDTAVDSDEPVKEDPAGITGNETEKQESTAETVSRTSVKAAAADEKDLTVSGSKTASPTKLSSDRKTTVKLEMPSGEYKNKVDIVFVMDNSTSIKNSGYDFASNVESLFSSVVENNPGVDLKVAVIKFRGYATDMLDHMTEEYSGLTVYDESSKVSIMAAISNNEVPGSGSNAHSGLRMADKLLEADTDVEESNKYVVFLTDGKNYIWNNENDEPVSYYMQYAERTSVKNGGKPALNQKAGIYNKEQGGDYANLTQIPDRTSVNFLPADSSTSAYYQRLFDSDNAELASTSTKYDEPAYYTKYYDSYSGNATVGEGTVTKRTLTNGSTIFNKGAQVSYRDYYEYAPDTNTFWKDIDYLQLNPYEVVKNEDGSYSYDTDKVNEDFFLWHPDAFQKGTYQVGHYWKDEIVAKYNAASVSFDPKSGGGTNLAGSFHHWLLETSDFGSDITDSDSVSAMFEDIDNSIRYMVGSGVVEDKITDEFDLDIPSDGSSPFTMTLAGEELVSNPGTEANTWTFGEAVDGVYPYTVEYDPSGNRFFWTINVPIENLRKVSLSYDLILKDGYGTGTYPTNKSAVLTYTSSDGKYKDRTYEFEIPEVTYAEPHKVTYKYTGTVPAGAPAVPAVKEYVAGDSVPKATVPKLTGYTFSGWNGEVTEMPDKDVTVTGSWKINSYKIVVKYVYKNGKTAAKTYSKNVDYKATYGPIVSPDIEGYTPDRTTIKGTMPARDLEFTVTYDTKDGGGDDPEDDPDDNPGGGDSDAPGGNPGRTVGIPIVIATVPPAAVTDNDTPTADIDDDDTPLAEEPEEEPETIEDEEAPLAGNAAWALLNLILTILTVLISVLLMIGYFRRDDEAEDQHDREQMADRKRFRKLFSIVPAIAAVIAFILTEDMTLPMVFTDRWTILMVIIAIIQVAVLAIARTKKDDNDNA